MAARNARFPPEYKNHLLTPASHYETDARNDDRSHWQRLTARRQYQTHAPNTWQCLKDSSEPLDWPY